MYPKRPQCLLCEQPFIDEQEAVCAPCTLQMRVGIPPFCRICGREMPEPDLCSDCSWRKERFFHRAVSFGPYEGRLRDAILKLKEERKLGLLPLLVNCLTEAYASHLFDIQIDSLVAVPMAADKERVRGFNQAERLAQGLSARVGLPVVEALLWHGASRSQVSRGRSMRLASMENSVALAPAAGELAGRTVCLIDDVYTTGATVNACAKKLHSAGVRAVYVLTVAR
ncbi:ComF family protein [Tumebacillus algifaecis]|nr:ComF family protein [Tumebacillus algifaecis]